MTKITIDFETQSEVDLKKAGAFEYASSPSTRVMCLAFKPEGDRAAHLFDFATMQMNWKQLHVAFRTTWLKWVGDTTFVFTAHNAFFEQCIYEQVLVKRLGWPRIPVHKWRCTAAKAAAVAIPRNLADAGAVMRTHTQKDFEGHHIMMKLCKPTKAWTAWAKKGYPTEEPTKWHTPENAPEDFRKLYHYCKIDVLSEEQLDRSLPDLNSFEQRLWEIDQKMNLRGIAVDMPLVNKIANIMATESRAMNKNLDALTMGLVSSGNARQAILDFLALEEIELPDLRAKTVDDFLANGKASGDAAKILKIRQALSKASTAKYKTFQLRAKTDGRVRDLLLYHAASTGRWGGKGIQPQNFPRGIIKDIFEAIERIKTCALDDLKMLYGENLMPLFSSVLRGMFIATKGQELFVEDYSAIECRVTWWLAGHEAGLDMFRAGIDPYRAMAAVIFKKSILEVTDEERQVGKAAVLGCGYQMGGKKFMTSAWDVYRAKVDLATAKIAVTAYRDEHWPVAEMWEAYENAAIAAVENPGKVAKVGRVRFQTHGRFLKIILPSGRCLSYCDPMVKSEIVYAYVVKGEANYTGSYDIFKAALKAGATEARPFDTKRLSYMATNHKAKKIDCVIPKWTREKTYGGKLTENIVQAVARDILAEAIVRADRANFNILMHSHDELVVEAPKGAHTEKKFRAIMEELPAWAEGLPLKSSGWMGDRYKKG